MLKSYLKIAWRNLYKNKVFSLINIFGLSVGIAFTLLISAYVWGGLQVNRDLKDANNQYIIQSKWKDPDLGGELTSVAELPKALANDYPNLVSNYYHSDLMTTIVSKGDRHYRENLQIGDSTLLRMYGFKLLFGYAPTALDAPFSVLITRSMALKYFGRMDVTGQTLEFESMQGDKHDFIITGVLADIPKNSVTDINRVHSDFFFAAEAAKFFHRNLKEWWNTGTIDYVELKKGIDPKTVNKAMRSLLDKYEADNVIRKGLTPFLVSLHDYNMEADGGVVKKMTRTLACIALFILLMAIVNFVNICIGRSAGRMKEMGIRKVMGGLRKHLIWQFLAESVLMVMIATILALAIFAIARPYFSNVLGEEVTGLSNFPVYFIPLPFVLALLVGIVAGTYPALVLSALKSVDSLKGKLTSVTQGVLLRKTLVAFQFSTAAIIVIGAVIVSQQVNLFFEGDLGYNKNYILYTQLPRDWSAKGVNKMEAIRAQLEQMPQVSSASLSFEIPDGRNGGNYLTYRQGDPAHTVSVTGLATDAQFATVYHIPVKAGTYFKPVYSSADSTKIVINQTEATALGWPNAADAIGQKIIIPAYSSTQPYTVCGVLADFHFGSLRDKITPVAIMNVNYSHAYRYFSIRFKPGDVQGSLAALQKKFAAVLPGAPFEYHFMDDALTKVYANEIQLKKATYIATALSIIIVLLGVSGLIALSIQKRTKEIGIRKVLGSSVAGIISLFLKDFFGVLLLASAIACPLAYLVMQKWLGDYAYRIRVSFTPFVVSIVLLTFVTALFIVLQTVKAALANPVKSLKSE